MRLSVKLGLDVPASLGNLSAAQQICKAAMPLELGAAYGNIGHAIATITF